MILNRTYKILLGCLLILIILVPLGLIASGTAYGEWGSDELKEMVGFIPSGLEHLSSLYSAPMPDYDFASASEDNASGSPVPGYYFSAIIGVVLAFIILFVIGKILTKGRSD
jgi:hypothetical protein